MTSNERKIINFLRDAKEKTHIRMIAKKINFSSDYTQSLCHSLARAGYIKLEDSKVCHLLKKGHGYFENVVAVAENSESVMATANVTILSDDLTSSASANERDEKGEINQQVDNGELDKVLAELDTPSGKRGEQEERAEEKEEKTKEDESGKKPAEEPQKVQAGIDGQEEIKIENPENAPVLETKPEAELQEVKEEKPADNSKEKSAKPIGGFGVSFKKIVPIAKLSRILDKVGINWFAQKK